VPTCNGSGTCVDNGTQSCGNYQCTGDACGTTCLDDGGCATGVSCVGGLCVRKRDNGLACASPGECASGFCADGVCCESACTETCRRCDGAVSGRCEILTVGRDSNASPSCNAPRRCTDGGICR
jgi:hypothetical protein